MLSRSSYARLIAGVAMMLGCWLNNAMAAVRVSQLQAASETFGFGDIALSCRIKNQGSASLTADTASCVRYAFRISANGAEQSWSSSWLQVPALGPRRSALLSSTLSVQPDPSQASQISELTITILIDEGKGVIQQRKEVYYRWGSGLFHPTPEEFTATSTAWEPAPLEDKPGPKRVWLGKFKRAYSDKVFSEGGPAQPVGLVRHVPSDQR